MFKNLEIWSTTKCNSRCIMCHAWKKPGYDLEIFKLKKLFQNSEFKTVCNLQVSGGEPTERNDLYEFISVITKNLTSLKKILLATNGTRPEYTINVLKKIRKKTNINFKLAVGLEGRRSVNKKIRGIDSYDLALKTLTLAKKELPDMETMILMTLTSINSNKENLDHLRDLASFTDSSFSYRIVYSNPHHFCNDNSIKPNKKQKENIIEFTEKYYNKNPFLNMQKNYLLKGYVPFKNICKSGLTFANIRANGSVYPCISSKTRIGDFEKGIFNLKHKGGIFDRCNYCCDEACFYPNYNY